MQPALVTGALLTFLVVGIPAQEDASTNPLEQVRQGVDYTAKVDWEDGYIEVVGEATCDPSLSVNQSHCYTMALKAARALAYEKLAETVHGLHVSSSNTFQDEVIKNTTLRTAVNGLIQNARIVSEDQTIMPDGSPLVRVKLGVLINGPKGLGAAVAQHTLPQDMTPEIAKLRADFERALADLEETKNHARRLETLVQQASQAAQDARQAASGSGDTQTASKALEQAAAAVRIAEEARRAADEVAQRATEAQARQAQVPGTSSEDVRLAQEAAQEAREIAARLAKSAADAQASAQEAQAASVSAGEQSRQVADLLQRSQEVAVRVDAAREEADKLREENAQALSKLAMAQSALATDNSTATEALTEARRASGEARQAREQAISLERQLREARLVVDSLTARSAASRDVEMERLTVETQRLAGELETTRQHQAELAARFEAQTSTAMSRVGDTADAAAAQALAEARAAAQEARGARERADALERQLQDARNAVDRLSAKPPAEREAEVVRLSAETKRLADDLAVARQKQTAFEAQTTEAMSRLTDTDNKAVMQALNEARQASQEAKTAREKAVSLERQLTQARLASESAATSSAAQREAEIQALAAQTRRLAEELSATRTRQSQLEKETTTAMSQATRAIEQLGGQQASPEVAALVADLKRSAAQTQQLQTAVAALERRAASAEAEASKMREALNSGTAGRADLALVMEQATAASRAVQTLMDSLRSAPVTMAAVPSTSTGVSGLSKTPYTGLIVDAGSLGARPALKPRVFSTDGDEVYGESKASREVALKSGYASWSDSPETVREKAAKRVGDNPLVVRAVEATGKNRSDIVVSREDALLIDRADRTGGFLKDCKVAITILPQA